jgi:hypothetical protein
MPNLTTSGSPTFNGDSTCTIDDTGPDRVQVPINLFNATQGWFAMRLAPTWAAVDQPYGVNGDMRLFCYRNASDNDRLEVLYKEASDAWQILRFINAGVDPINALTAVQTFAANSHHTVIGAWTSSGGKISSDGVAFVSDAGADTPSLPNKVVEIGNRDDGIRAVKAVVYWVAMGLGTLTDADAATINNFGDTDPLYASWPDPPRMFWSADTIYYMTPGPDPPLFVSHTSFGPF